MAHISSPACKAVPSQPQCVATEAGARALARAARLAARQARGGGRAPSAGGGRGAQVPTRVAVSIKQVPLKVAYGIKAYALMRTATRTRPSWSATCSPSLGPRDGGWRGWRSAGRGLRDGRDVSELVTAEASVNKP